MYNHSSIVLCEDYDRKDCSLRLISASCIIAPTLKN